MRSDSLVGSIERAPARSYFTSSYETYQDSAQHSDLVAIDGALMQQEKETDKKNGSKSLETKTY